MMNLKNISTKELVEELGLREGVQTTIVGPCEEKTVKVNGPTIVLEVID